jgi:hypothetical protein
MIRTTLKAILNQHCVTQTVDSAYYSEATIQHKLGIELYKRLGVESVLEKKIPHRNEYLDMFTQFEGLNYGIELKYKTRSANTPGFEYTNQGAQNNGRYDYIWDISRLESYKTQGLIDHGFAVFLTNDNTYCSSPREGSKVAAFNLSQGRILNGLFHPEWEGRNIDIRIRGNYDVNWTFPANAANSVAFWYCLVEI